MIVIFRGNQIEVMNIKNLLDNVGIESFIQNQHMSVLEPWLVTAGGYNATTLQIESSDYEKAKKILDDFNNGEYNLDI
jgi:hypothetical protein